MTITNFFKTKKGYPKFKRKHDNKQSFRFPNDAFSGINGNRINLINMYLLPKFNFFLFGHFYFGCF